MPEALVLNAVVDLVVGVALWLGWRVDRGQDPARWLGGSFAAQAVVPLAALAWRAGDGVTSTAAALAAVGFGSASLGLWLFGAARLAGRQPEARRYVAGSVLLALAGAGALGAGLDALMLLGALATAAAGLCSLAWLHRLGRCERVAAAAMLLIGPTHLLYLAAGPAALPWQVGVATLLRVVLGVSLVHAAIGRRLAESGRLRDQFSHLIERSHQGLAVMQGEQMKYANPALLRIYGLPDEGGAALAGMQAWRASTMAERDQAIARERHRRIVAGEIAQDHWEGERQSFDGRRLRLRFSAWRVEWDGQPAEQIVVTDDTAHFDAMQTLLHQATHDELTGLPNRSALLQRLRELCAGAPRQPFALLLLDIDRFKLFNEAHGPSVGDDVLRALASALNTRFGTGAEVMRLGEDEFALLAPAAAAERRAGELVQGVRQLLLLPFELPSHRFFLDVSMGIALHPATAVDPEALLRAANAAMHEAKRTPGTSAQFAEARFEHGSGATLDAEQALRAGMKSDEFRLVYQPKVDAASGALVGFEALARWDRPGIGQVDPCDFISAAERTGLIGPLGNLILTLACHQVAQWREAFGRPVPVAVNVSPLQLLEPGFPELVLRTLRHFGVPPELLTLEITESAAVTHMAQASDQIRQMRAFGVEVALDDFGTGFSSLNMLRSLPLSAVKIDRSLIDPMPAPDAAAVVKAICDLAAVLRIEVVAEGVETESHASSALAAGCQVLQGFLYARPLDPAAAAAWLRLVPPAAAGTGPAARPH